MANSFIATTVAGDLTVTDNVYDGNSDDSILDRINNDFDKLTTMFCADEVLEISTTNSTNWTVNDASAYLVGNILRVYFLATRKSAPTGNFTAESMGSITIQDGGRIKEGYAMSINTSGTGSPFSGYANFTNSDTTTKVNFYMSGTRSANTQKQFGVMVHFPVFLSEAHY